MLRKILCWCVVVALAGGFVPVAAQGATDPEIQRGMKQVDEGEYDAAILTLDAAVRRLAGQPGRQAELGQAYLYLGVAYLGKGHETSARARFRDALKQARDLNPSPDRFAPRVIELFEKAREEVGASAPAAAASPAPAVAPTAEKKGGSKLPLILIGVGGLAAAGVAVAAGGGGGDGDTTGGLRETSFPNETVVFGGGRDFVVTAGGSGTLTATVNWEQQGVMLDMYIVALNNTPQVLTTGNQTATRQMTLTLPVTAQAYRISVTNSSGMGPQVTTTFTLRVMHP